MKAFAELVRVLGTSTKTNEKLDALSDYFTKASDQDKVWVIAIFSGRRPKRAVSAGLLQAWCAEVANIPLWLFEECYHTVGDLGETIALLLPETKGSVNEHTLAYYIFQLMSLSKADEDVKKE